MVATGAETHFDNDGKAVDVDLTATVAASQVAVSQGFLGITGSAGVSGDTIALNIDQRAYQFTVPTSLTVNKGDIVWVDMADLTGHTPDDSAYSTSAGSGKRALFIALATKSATHMVPGILLPRGVGGL